MEIIGAAALIAVGIVLAAVLYGRVHGAGVAVAGAQAAGATAVEVELPERTASLAQREAGLARREAELALEVLSRSDGCIAFLLELGIPAR